mgnify:CR=1 FL=1
MSEIMFCRIFFWKKFLHRNTYLTQDRKDTLTLDCSSECNQLVARVFFPMFFPKEQIVTFLKVTI